MTLAALSSRLCDNATTAKWQGLDSPNLLGKKDDR